MACCCCLTHGQSLSLGNFCCDVSQPSLPNCSLFCLVSLLLILILTTSSYITIALIPFLFTHPATHFPPDSDMPCLLSPSLCHSTLPHVGSLTTTMWRRLCPFPSGHSFRHSRKKASSLSQRLEVQYIQYTGQDICFSKLGFLRADFMLC